MQWFQNLRVSLKLIISFLLVATVGAAVSALGIFHMGRISAGTEKLYSHELRTLKAAQAANIHLLYASRAQMGLLSASTKGERNAGVAELRKAGVGLAERVAEVKSVLEESEEGGKLYKQYEALSAPLKKGMGEFVTLISAQSLDSSQFEGRVAEDSAQLLKDSRALEQVLEKMVAHSDELARQSMEDATQTFKTSRLMMMAMALAGVLVSVALGVLVSRVLSRQLGGEPGYAADAVGRIATGDLTNEVDAQSARTGSVLHSIKQMQDQLTHVVGKIKLSSDAIATASGQIAAG
ncbi:MAG: MCP four helix bundle domain-containing protein, partial [Variovorax sp.]